MSEKVTSDLYTFRRGKQEDAGLILNSWLKSYRNGWMQSDRSNPPIKNVRGDIFFKEHHSAILDILKSAKIICAVSKDDENQIYGWICLEGDTVHYIYVKQIYRNYGIASDLLEHALGDTEEFFYTHYPFIETSLTVGGVYNPYKIHRRESA